MVEVTAIFDKPRYRTGGEMRIQFGMKNIGTAPATVFVRFDTLDPDVVKLRSRGDLELGRTVTIAPGATHTTTLVGAMGNPDVTIDESNENDDLLVRAVRPLTGIVANRNRSGEGPGLDGRGPGWGDLAGEGVTIGARQTRTVEVSEEMPDNAVVPGRVRRHHRRHHRWRCRRP